MAGLEGVRTTYFVLVDGERRVALLDKMHVGQNPRLPTSVLKSAALIYNVSKRREVSNFTGQPVDYWLTLNGYSEDVLESVDTMLAHLPLVTRDVVYSGNPYDDLLKYPKRIQGYTVTGYRHAESGFYVGEEAEVVPDNLLIRGDSGRTHTCRKYVLHLGEEKGRSRRAIALRAYHGLHIRECIVFNPAHHYPEGMVHLHCKDSL